MDQMTRGEKLTLFLLVGGQIFSVFMWYTNSIIQSTIPSAVPWIQLIFGVVASTALDLDVVITTVGRRDGRRSWWSWAATGTAAFFSAAIALSIAGGPSLGPWLHVAYAINIFFFAQHISQPKIVEGTAVETPSIPTYEDIQTMIKDTLEESLPPTPLRSTTPSSRETRLLSTSKTNECPHCSAELKNWQTRSAAVRLGYCEFCKPGVS